MIRGLIFDFDGLILETEEPIYRAWQEIYQQHGCHLAFDTWTSIIGTADYAFEPLEELERQYGAPIDRESVHARQRALEAQLIQVRSAMPGVQAYMQDAQRLGLRIGLASSSDSAWVTGHLDRLGLLGYFDAIKTSDDVLCTKPDPELFLSVLAALDLSPREAIVLEDSPHGVEAAHRAGIFTVAVPNAMTRELEFDHPEIRLGSLTDISLEDLLNRVNGSQMNAG